MLSLVWKSARIAWPHVRGLPRQAAIGLGAPIPGLPARPHRLRDAIALICPLALLVGWAMPQIIWVTSPSIDAIAVTPATGPVGKGDLVMFHLRHPLAGPEPVRVTKYALCMPGERLAAFPMRSRQYSGRIDTAYLCEGSLLGIAKPVGHGGQRLTPFRWQAGPVPQGQAYVGSGHRDGFDSRYFGLVPIARLQRMERLL